MFGLVFLSLPVFGLMPVGLDHEESAVCLLL